MDVINSLKKIVGKEQVLYNALQKEVYSYDSSPYSGLPQAVVFPSTTSQVVEVVTLCQETGLSICPRGAGTCLSGGAAPNDNDIMIVLTKMDKIIFVDLENEVALVEPGVINYSLQERIDPLGYFFAPDPSSFRIATIGGNVSLNAGGIKGVKYGVTKNHIVGLEVVLPNGEMLKTGQLASDVRPEVDLTNLFCGSEGTLGIITKILVKLTKKPESTKTMLVAFDSLEDAGNLVASILASGITPTALEIMDQTVTQAVEDYVKLGLPRNIASLLLIEVDGPAIEVKSQSDKIIDLFSKFNVKQYQIAQSVEERENIWKARRAANGALGKLKSAYMVQDIVVPINKLTEMLNIVSSLAKKYNVLIGQVGHAGDGNLHPTLLYDHNDTEELERVELANADIFRETLKLGGTLSGEHGIGIEKLPYMEWAFNKEELDFFRFVKISFDPKWIFNKGKLISAKNEG